MAVFWRRFCVLLTPIAIPRLRKPPTGRGFEWRRVRAFSPPDPLGLRALLAVPSARPTIFCAKGLHALPRQHFLCNGAISPGIGGSFTRWLFGISYVTKLIGLILSIAIYDAEGSRGICTALSWSWRHTFPNQIEPRERQLRRRDRALARSFLWSPRDCHSSVGFRDFGSGSQGTAPAPPILTANAARASCGTWAAH
jgi:hypothetical protein